MNNNNDDFLSLYLQYSAGTECPAIYHRWAAITSLGAYLSRDIYFRQGHSRIYPNIYTILIGDAGVRKTTAISMVSDLIELTGYNKFAARKTRQEKFLLDMAEVAAEEQGESLEDSILEQNLWGDKLVADGAVAESFIAADEFNNFIGVGNTDFMSILGEFWDYKDKVYDYKLKNSKSIYLNRPIVSILGGNTPTGMNLCFPPDSIGQGFFSRLLLIHAESTGKKVTWMPLADEELQKTLIKRLHKTKEMMQGEIVNTVESAALLHKIYQTWTPFKDIRFASYANRRFPVLLKLVLIICANNLTRKITEKEVIYANTLLTAAERNMSEALGEFGKSKHSDVTHKILQYIDTATVPLMFKDIWKQVINDIERREHLMEILSNLQMADKIQLVDHGWLPVREIVDYESNDMVDWSLLSEEERGVG